MKIALIANYELLQQQSMIRFANLLQHLFLNSEHNVKIIRPTIVFGRLFPNLTMLNKWLGYIDQFLIFPIALRKEINKFDFFHICDHANAMYIPIIQKKPYLITCHDLLAIRSAKGEIKQNKLGITGKILQRWILNNLRKAKAVVFISKKTQEEFKNTLKAESPFSKVIYTGQQFDYQPSSQTESDKYLSQLGIKNINYFIHVGGNQWYKNRIGALKLFHALTKHKPYANHHFLMVGKKLTDEISRYIKANNLANQVHEFIDLPNETLMALYTKAEALLFPSLAEGAGWPPLEAQACGCPVVLSDISPLNELSDRNSAIFIDPEKLEEASAEIYRELQNREKLIAEGFKNANKYSKLNMRVAYEEAYHQIKNNWATINESKSLI